MNRPKYKIGTMVRYNEDQHGTIEAIVTRKNGFSYHLEGKTFRMDNPEVFPEAGAGVEWPVEVAENTIDAAFRVVTAHPRKSRTATETAPKLLKKKTSHLKQAASH